MGSTYIHNSINYQRSLVLELIFGFCSLCSRINRRGYSDCVHPHPRPSQHTVVIRTTTEFLQYAIIYLLTAFYKWYTVYLPDQSVTPQFRIYSIIAAISEIRWCYRVCCNTIEPSIQRWTGWAIVLVYMKGFLNSCILHDCLFWFILHTLPPPPTPPRRTKYIHTEIEIRNLRIISITLWWWCTSSAAQHGKAQPSRPAKSMFFQYARNHHDR